MSDERKVVCPHCQSKHTIKMMDECEGDKTIAEHWLCTECGKPNRVEVKSIAILNSN
jgi:transposase-like protein